MAEVVYAVHTRTCSYLLDEDGVCRWIISPTGMVPVDVRRCVGAQFVACLDTSIQGALMGELVLGAAALFVKHDLATGRMILLRTSRIEHVEFRGPAAEAMRSASPPPPAPPPYRRVAAAAAPVRLSKATTFDDSFLDPDELVQYDAETTVTLTMPLFRPHLQGRPAMADAGRGGAGHAPPPSSSMATTLKNPPPASGGSPGPRRRGRGRGPAADK